MCHFLSYGETLCLNRGQFGREPGSRAAGRGTVQLSSAPGQQGHKHESLRCDQVRGIVYRTFVREKENNVIIKMLHLASSCLSSLADPEPASQSSANCPAAAGVAAQLKHPKVVEQLTLIQKARTWADRHHVTRNSMQRHNRARQGLQQSLFHLQQPGRRSLAH